MTTLRHLCLLALLLGCAGGEPRPRRREAPPPPAEDAGVPSIVMHGEPSSSTPAPPRPAPAPEPQAPARRRTNDGRQAGLIADFAGVAGQVAHGGRAHVLRLLTEESRSIAELNNLSRLIDAYLDGAPPERATADCPLRRYERELAGIFDGIDQLPGDVQGVYETGQLPIWLFEGQLVLAGPFLFNTSFDASTSMIGERVATGLSVFLIPALKKAHMALAGTPFTRVGVLAVYAVTLRDQPCAEAVVILAQRDDVSRAIRGVLSDADLVGRSELRVATYSAPMSGPLERLPFDPAALGTLAPAAPGSAGAGDAGEVLGTGSGFLVGPTSVLTNAHVVEGARRVRVQLTSGRAVDATVVAVDRARDLALLRLPERAGDGLPFSGAVPRPGSSVFAYGYGRFVGSTETLILTRGGVSAVDRAQIVFDARINPGNSGGPLVNGDGQVVGVVVARSEEPGVESLAIAIPAAVALEFLDAQDIRVRRAQPSGVEQLPPDEVVRAATVRVIVY